MKTGFTRHTVNDLEYFTSPDADSAGGLKHMFTTRHGGVSDGPLKSLNLGMGRDEPLQNKLANYEIACNAIGVDYTRLTLSKQTHGINIRLVAPADWGKGVVREGDIAEADGLATDAAGTPIAVFYADCVPILLYDPKKRAVAAVHAGWRGTVGGISYKGVSFMMSHFSSDPSDILAAIGPSIGPCCFETGHEVLREFEKAGLAEAVVKIYGGKCKLDLWRANAAMLKRAGIPDSNITVAGECTCCHPERYFSHRACGAGTGRMALIACLE